MSVASSLRSSPPYLLLPLRHRPAAQILIVTIMTNKRNVLLPPQRRVYRLRQRRLPGAGTAGDADDKDGGGVRTGGYLPEGVG